MCCAAVLRDDTKHSLSATACHLLLRRDSLERSAPRPRLVRVNPISLGRVDDDGRLVPQGSLPQLHCSMCTLNALSAFLSLISTSCVAAGGSKPSEPTGTSALTETAVIQPVGARVLQAKQGVVLLRHVRDASKCVKTWIVGLVRDLPAAVSLCRHGRGCSPWTCKSVRCRVYAHV